MENSADFLLSWAEHYFRSRDAFYKNIQSMGRKDGRLHIAYKDKEEDILPYPELKVPENVQKNISIITLNIRKNLDELYDNWDKYASIVSLKVYFINPSSSLEKKWVISPYVHSKISDKSSLKAGLNALFETVEPVLQENVQS
ncbi:hypothetical protein J4401_07010 [Candidatus Woesearchaeota archaeon]|nr:hypothetical protein [Candidatus Woesearchaeota archaeon]